MKNKALLVYGVPHEKEDGVAFKKASQTNIELMTHVAKANGYNADVFHLYNFDISLENYHNSDKFLFYFTGHSNSSHLGSYKNSLDDFLSSVGKIRGEKIIILDSCTEEFIKTKKFPQNTKVFGAHHSYDYRSLAKLFYELTQYYGKDFEKITKRDFDEIKQNWVYVGDVK